MDDNRLLYIDTDEEEDQLEYTLTAVINHNYKRMMARRRYLESRYQWVSLLAVF